MKQKKSKNKSTSTRLKLDGLKPTTRNLRVIILPSAGWPIALGALTVGVFVALMPSRLGIAPTGPINRVGDMFDKVALALHIQPSSITPEVVQQPSSTDVKSPSSNIQNAQPQNNDGSHFYTLPPGSILPSDSECALRVRPKPEVRPANSVYNNTKGVGGNTEFSRVTGNFTGTTDEILQWAACKWGVDEDIAKAQAVKESWWFHRTMGDFSTDPAMCWPPNNTLGADPSKPGQCPESVGILQVRYQYHNSGLAPGTYSPYYSTAYNADYTYAVWRDCYEGNMTWLNMVEKGATYTAGDEWGCVGEWFSGRWYTPSTIPYINAVKDYLNQRMWEHSNFLAAT